MKRINKTEEKKAQHSDASSVAYTKTDNTKTANTKTGDVNSPIRRISKDEQDSRRRWPSKDQLASSHDIPLPKPGEKNRIQSVLVALPVLMLMIGLFVYFKGESAQINGAPILSEMVERQGAFKSVSKVSGIGKARYYLWYTDGDRTRGVRIRESQRINFENLAVGSALSLQLVPTVEGSNTLWAYRVSNEGSELVVPNESF